VSMQMMTRTRTRTRTMVVAWCLWLATMSLCVAGLVVTLVVIRPLTLQVLAGERCSRWRSRSGTRPRGWCGR
jgi:hypothetical protein